MKVIRFPTGAKSDEILLFLSASVGLIVTMFRDYSIITSRYLGLH